VSCLLHIIKNIKSVQETANENHSGMVKEKTEPFYDELPSEKYGVPPEERNMELHLEYGFVPLDKPPGYSSFEVVSWVKRMLEAKKAGHSGTLDPSVSGLLPIAINSATKALGALLLGPKEYIAVMKLHENVPAEKVIQAINMFKDDLSEDRLSDLL